MTKTIIYGDIHGCIEEFENLREKIQPTKEDKEILLGDILEHEQYCNELL